MKVVFDTNVFVSGFLYESGTPAALIKAASDGECELFCSPHILDELRRVLPEKFGLRYCPKVTKWCIISVKRYPVLDTGSI